METPCPGCPGWPWARVCARLRPAEKSQVRGRAEFSQASAGTAGELKDRHCQSSAETAFTQCPVQISSETSIEFMLPLAVLQFCEKGF